MDWNLCWAAKHAVGLARGDTVVLSRHCGTSATESDLRGDERKE